MVGGQRRKEVCKTHHKSNDPFGARYVTVRTFTLPFLHCNLVVYSIGLSGVRLFLNLISGLK